MSGPEAKHALFDSHNRRIDYMRLSLTDRCTFRCLYCMPPEGVPYLPHSAILRYDELLRLCRVSAGLGVSRYKVTGGEPLCRKEAVGFIRRLKALPGVRNVTLTTNGLLLGDSAAALAEAGIDSVTVSLDAFTQDTFRRITRSDARLDAVFDAMDRSVRAGLRVKINVVPIRGVNDAELTPLARYALERGYHIRFIELMPVGKINACAGVSRDEVWRMLETTFGPLIPVQERTGNGPAVNLRVSGLPGLVGFIAALSHAFCDTCNRIRLTSVGFLKTCLCHDKGVDLRKPLRAGAGDDELARTIQKAVWNKPRAHTFANPAATEASFFMNSVGG